MPLPPLFGLVLAGGASKRMGKDKAALVYHGQTQLQRTFDLLSGVCVKTFVSVRADQASDATRAAFPQIVDTHPGIGPIAGIGAALAEYPDAAWMVVACDLPFLSRAALEYLIANRDPQQIATAYLSTQDNLPEPLCAIWEPQSRELVMAWIAADKRCPRKLLLNSDAKLLAQPHEHALDNFNTPEDWQHVKGSVNGAPDTLMKTIQIRYFALLREQTGRSEESLATTAATPAAVYAELQARYPFTLAAKQLRVAVNNEFGDWDVTLKDGDTLVFIPPVAGG